MEALSPQWKPQDTIPGSKTMYYIQHPLSLSTLVNADSLYLHPVNEATI